MCYTKILWAVCVIHGVLSSACKQKDSCMSNRQDDGKFAGNACPFQEHGENISRCKTEHYSNQACDDLQFSKKSCNKLSEVNLHHEIKYYNDLFYIYNSISIKFSKIKWQKLIFRTKTKTRGQRSNCTEYQILPGAKLSYDTQLHWCCRLYNETFENEKMELEYAAFRDSEQETRHYIFKMPMSSKTNPNNTILSNWQVFVYLDITASDYITVYWQAHPKQFGVKSYLVEMIDNKSNMPVEHTRHVSAEFKEQEDFSCEFSVLQSGEFYFTVRHENCHSESCISRSPTVLIDVPSKMPFIIGTCSGILLLLLLFASFLRYKASLKLSEIPPSVFVIYKRVSQHHVDVVLALAEYLRLTSHVDAKVDEFDIPLSHSKNPFIWCQDTFKNADAVMVVSSPPLVMNHEAGIYRDVADIGLRLLAENFSDNGKKLFSVILPSCTVDDLPKEAINLQRFILLKDLDKMLWFIHYGSKSYWITNLYFLFRSHIPGGKSKLQSEGRRLLTALEDAALEVASFHPSSLNEDIDLLEVIKPAPLNLDGDTFSPFQQQVHNEDLSDCETFPGTISEILSEEDYLKHENYKNNINDMMSFINDIREEDSELVISKHSDSKNHINISELVL